MHHPYSWPGIFIFAAACSFVATVLASTAFTSFTTSIPRDVGEEEWKSMLAEYRTAIKGTLAGYDTAAAELRSLQDAIGNRTRSNDGADVLLAAKRQVKVALECNLATLEAVYEAASVAIDTGGRSFAVSHKDGLARSRYQTAEQLLVHLARDYSKQPQAAAETAGEVEVIAALLRHTAAAAAAAAAAPSPSPSPPIGAATRRTRRVRSILVPGAGLGGLAHAIAALPTRSFAVEANELSYVFGTAAYGLWQACADATIAATCGPNAASTDGNHGNHPASSKPAAARSACRLKAYPYAHADSNVGVAADRGIHTVIGGDEVWGGRDPNSMPPSPHSDQQNPKWKGGAGGGGWGQRHWAGGGTTLPRGTLRMVVGDFNLVYGAGDEGTAPACSSAKRSGGGGGGSGGGATLRYSDGRRILSEGGRATATWLACFDAVVTHFFIDTQQSTVNTVLTIAQNVAAGGLWINFGPLHYHHSTGVGWSVDQLEAVLLPAAQFELLESRTVGNVSYHPAMPSAMRREVYTCWLLVARKRS